MNLVTATKALAANITVIELLCDGALVASHVVMHFGYTSRENELIAATHELLAMAGLKAPAF